MEIEAAIEIMRALADGIDPETRAPLNPDSLCRRPLCVRAFNRSVAALISAQERQKNTPIAAYRSWTVAEDAQVCEELRNSMDFAAIAAAHNRSIPAIVARLVKLGKIAAPKKLVASHPDRLFGT